MPGKSPDAIDPDPNTYGCDACDAGILRRGKHHGLNCELREPGPRARRARADRKHSGAERPGIAGTFDPGAAHDAMYGRVSAPPPSAALVVVRPAPGSAAIERATLVEAANEFMDASLSDATRRAYASDWRTFSQWCLAAGVDAMPATVATLVLYLTSLAKAGKKVATIERAKSAISVAHEVKRPPVANPAHASEVKRTMKGIANRLKVAQTKKKAVLGDDIEKMIRAALKNGVTDVGSLRSCRDAALLAVGFAGGFRRSEVAVIHVEHLRFEMLDADTSGAGSGARTEAVAVFIPRAKTDQEGKGRHIGITHEATVAFLRAWLVALNRDSGPVFVPIDRYGHPGNEAMSGDAVGDVVKKYAEAVGFDPKKYAGHSLRRGFITTTIRQGKHERDIMRQTGHRSTSSFREYVEEASVFLNNASGDLWGGKK